MSLSTEHKKMLIRLARDEISHHLLPVGKFKIAERDFPEILREKCGAFVTLYVDNHLRGCIGTFSEDEPLYMNIKRMALAAAMHDNRFAPLRTEELEQLRIEISVLSPRLQIRGPAEIEIGRHGIYIENGVHSGTFLPQVAVEQQWTQEEFLGHCAQSKANLNWDGWKSARIFTYEAIVFDSDIFQLPI